MKSMLLVLAFTMSFSQFAKAADDYNQAYAWIAISSMSTSFPLIPFFLTSDLATNGRTQLSDLTDDLHKEILASQDDIAYFVATEGQAKQVRVEALFKKVRNILGDRFEGDDLELAYGLMVQ
jgi:Protein of unknown function (DUF2388).